MKDRKLADVEFSLEWKSPFATHTDIYVVYNVDPLNDKLPLDFGEKISKLKVGEDCSQTFPAKDILEDGFSSNQVVPFSAKLFDQVLKASIAHQCYTDSILVRLRGKV